MPLDARGDVGTSGGKVFAGVVAAATVAVAVDALDATVVVDGAEPVAALGVVGAAGTRVDVDTDTDAGLSFCETTGDGDVCRDTPARGQLD